MSPSSFKFKFQGFTGNSLCAITVGLTDARRGILVCSQLRDSRGTSITNGVEEIASKLYREAMSRKLDGHGEAEAAGARILRGVWDTADHTARSLSEIFGDDTVIWIEHYPSGTGLIAGDSFRQIVFTDDSSPIWRGVFDAVAASVKFRSSVISAAIKFAGK